MNRREFNVQAVALAAGGIVAPLLATPTKSEASLISEVLPVSTAHRPCILSEPEPQKIRCFYELAKKYGLEFCQPSSCILSNRNWTMRQTERYLPMTDGLVKGEQKPFDVVYETCQALMEWIDIELTLGRGKTPAITAITAPTVHWSVLKSWDGDVELVGQEVAYLRTYVHLRYTAPHI